MAYPLDSLPRITLKGEVIQAIVAANPTGHLKAVEYDSFGGIKRVEWEYEAPPPLPRPPENDSNGTR